MKTLKNSWISITAFVALLAISVVGAVTDRTMRWHISGGNDMVLLISAVIGLALIAALLFVKEEYLYKAAPWIYLVAVAVLAFQIYDLDFSLDTSLSRNVRILGVSIYSSALIPFTYLLLSRLISEYNVLNHFKRVLVFIAALFPLCLVAIQINRIPILISLLVYCVVLVIVKKDGKIKIERWVAPVITVGVIAGLVYVYFETPSLRQKIDIILTRGESDPYGIGWIRKVLDGIFANTPVVGKTNFVIEDFGVNETISKFGGCNIVLVLANCGWLAFVGMILLYALIFFCLFKMMKATKQSSFARYISLFLTLSLFLHAVISLIGVFFLPSVYNDMPFLAHNYSVNILDYVAFGIIFALYLRRNRKSKLIEKEETKRETTESDFLIKVRDFISAADDK